MEFTDSTTREDHITRGHANITGADLMQDDSLRWDHMARRAVAAPTTFRPDRVTFSWRWSPELDEWVLTSLTVSGPQIKKDGTDSVKTRSLPFIRNGEVSGDTPLNLLRFVATLTPTSKVVQP